MKREPTGDLLDRIDSAIAETRALARERTATAVERTLRTASRSYHSSHCDYECLWQHQEASPPGGALWQVPTHRRWLYHPWEISPHLFDPPDPDEEPDPERVAGLQARIDAHTWEQAATSAEAFSVAMEAVAAEVSQVYGEAWAEAFRHTITLDLW